MKFVYFGLLVMCVVIEIKSEWTRNVCQGCQHGDYIRIKRAKYYSNPPLRFYNKPPMTYPIKGIFSYTPPPGYQTEEARQPQSSRPKVSSSRPMNEGLGDEDINNIMKYLSKQDLDKIVEFANEKERQSPNYVVNRGEGYESKDAFNDNASVLNNKFPYHENFMSSQQNSIEYSNPNINKLKETKRFKISEWEPAPALDNINKNQVRLNTLLDSERVIHSQQFSNVNQYEYEEGNANSANVFIDNSLMQEEQLPKPTNLREDDFEVSFTNNVPTIVKPNSDSYKIENLGALPLMNYHSKLESVDSYKVPHYTVTSPEQFRSSSSMTNIPVEPAPPVSTAKEQSDAHLKATKIWTHKSRGTAYTLHDDGTLSLEKPT